jgi:hypothetical protein
MEMRSTKQRLESGARALALIDRRRAETGLRNIGCNVERMAVERELAERDIVSRSTGLWVVSTLEQTAVRSGVKLGLYIAGEPSIGSDGNGVLAGRSALCFFHRRRRPAARIRGTTGSKPLRCGERSLYGFSGSSSRTTGETGLAGFAGYRVPGRLPFFTRCHSRKCH